MAIGPDDPIWNLEVDGYLQARFKELEEAEERFRQSLRPVIFARVFTDTFLSWQSVEAELFLIFNTLFTEASGRLISASFHSVISLDARLAMISSLAEMQLIEHPALLEEWGTLTNKVRKTSKKRNYLAHFSLHEHTTKTGVELGLRPSIYDSRPSTKDYGEAEMRQFADSFRKLHEELLTFHDQIRALDLP